MATLLLAITSSTARWPSRGSPRASRKTALARQVVFGSGGAGGGSGIKSDPEKQISQNAKMALKNFFKNRDFRIDLSSSYKEKAPQGAFSSWWFVHWPCTYAVAIREEFPSERDDLTTLLERRQSITKLPRKRVLTHIHSREGHQPILSRVHSDAHMPRAHVHERGHTATIEATGICVLANSMSLFASATTS